jgi:hypothetical protein
MPSLHDAAALRLGDQVVSKVMLGSNQAWPKLFKPTDLSGLRLWLDASQLSLANGATVNPWPDLSGNGLTPVTQGSPMPNIRTNVQKGLSVVYCSVFGQAGRYRWGATFGNPTGFDKDFTLFYFARMIGPTTQRVLAGIGDLGANMFFGYHQGKMDCAHNGAAWLTPDLRPAWTNAWRLYSIDGNGAGNRLRMFRDGVQILTGGSGHGFKSTLALNGFGQNSTSECSDFEIGELVAYNRELPDAERQQVEAYLRDKWLV